MSTAVQSQRSAFVPLFLRVNSCSRRRRYPLLLRRGSGSGSGSAGHVLSVYKRKKKSREEKNKGRLYQLTHSYETPSRVSEIVDSPASSASYLPSSALPECSRVSEKPALKLPLSGIATRNIHIALPRDAIPWHPARSEKKYDANRYAGSEVHIATNDHRLYFTGVSLRRQDVPDEFLDSERVRAILLNGWDEDESNHWLLGDAHHTPGQTGWESEDEFASSADDSGYVTDPES